MLQYFSVRVAHDSSCCTSKWWSNRRAITASVSSFSSILSLPDCLPNLGSKWINLGALPVVAKFIVRMSHTKSLATGGAGVTVAHGECPHHVGQEEPFSSMMPSLSQLEARLWISFKLLC